MQWIDTDKKEHEKEQARRDGREHVIELKSRMVACGNLESCEGIRTDSPTCPVEGVNLILAWCACNRLKLHTSDVTNAYFRSENTDRLILMRPPRGGIPGRDPSKKILLVGIKPVYGQSDSGRWFWKGFRRVCTGEGRLTEIRCMRALYYFAVDGDIKILFGTHVDDLIWGVKDGYEHILQPILQHYALEDKVENGPTYRFCGREIVQLPDFSIKVSCIANIIKILPINFNSRGRKDTDSATDGEKS